MSLKRPNYKKLYPQTESIVFDGGLDNKFERSLLPDNESPDCANVVFFNGSVTTRDGAVKLNTAAAGSNIFDGLYTRRDNTGAETMIAFIDGSMKYLNSTTFITVPSAQSVFTIGSRVGVDFAENYMFIGNGGAGPYKYNGNDFTQHGISAPVSGFSVVSNGAGSLTSSATYMWKQTFVNSALVESDVSPAITFVISSSGGKVNLSGLAVAPVSAGVVRRRIYRTQGNGVAFLRLTEISDDTTTTYTDNNPDSALGVAAPTDVGVPPQYNAIIYCRNILFVNDINNPNFVRYSEPGNPYSFPSTNFFKVGNNTSDLVKGFAGFDNHLVIFCEKSVWINYMSDPGDDTTWRQLPTNSPYGSKSPYGISNYLNKTFFPAVQNGKFVGFSSLSGIALDPTNTVLTVTNTGSDLQSMRIEPDMFQVQESVLNNISSIIFKNKAYVTVTFGSGNIHNNRMYCFDFSMSNLKKEQKVSWSPFTGLSAQQYTIYSGKLYFASSTTSGFVYQMDGTGVYSDDGVAIDSYYWTKEYPGFNPDTNYFKDFRYVNILIDTPGTYFMNVTYRSDSDMGVGTTQLVDLSPGGSIWGSFVWGAALWGGGTTQVEKRIYLSPTRGKRIQFRFSNQNTVGQRFKVYRMNFLYNIRGYR